MPYTIVHSGEEYCVHKRNPDGSAGERIACHATHDMAASQIGAIEHNERKSFVQFKQDSTGQWWFIGFYSNKYLDRDDEILSEAAHKEYADWYNANGIRSQVTIFHLPRPKRGFWYKMLKAHEDGRLSTSALNGVMKEFYKDFGFATTERVIYSNGFTIVVARVNPGKEKVVNNLINYKERLGMSHGFVPKHKSDNIFLKYRSFEHTVLPSRRAANIWNPEPLFTKKELDMQDGDKEFVNQVLGEGAADALDDQTQKMSQELEEAGVAFKETPEDDPEKSTDVSTETEELDTEKAFEELAKKVSDKLNLEKFAELVKSKLDEITEKLAAAEEQIKALEQDDDDKFSQQYQKQAFNLLEMFSKKSVDEVVDKQEAQKDLFDPVAYLLGGN